MRNQKKKSIQLWHRVIKNDQSVRYLINKLTNTSVKYIES